MIARSKHAEPGRPAPCRGACPVGTDAAAYVALISEGRIAEGYDVARAPNPFPSICGRICAAPCERACRRGVIDRPIAIRALKRVLSEAHGVEAEWGRWHRAVGEHPEPSGPSVGIVGAGPAGLSAAHDLLLNGVQVHLYERDARPGGMLVQGVPPFRLPRELVAREIEAIVGLGATLETGCTVGIDVDIGTLLERHAAVLVAVGCRQGKLLKVPGVGLRGVIRAVDYLRRANAPDPESAFGRVEGPVVVIGGGSVAFDSARSIWRLQRATGWDGQALVDAARLAARAGPGGEGPSVTIVAPESRAALPVPHEELAEAEREGVRVLDRSGALEIVGEDRVEGVRVAPVRILQTTEGGAIVPELEESAADVLPARTVVLAIGQQADITFLAEVEGIRETSSGGAEADLVGRTGRTGHPRIFAAGDVATGPRDLIDAVAAGQRTAAAIVEALANDARTLDAPTRVDELPARAVNPPAVPTAPGLDAPHRYWSGYDAVPRAALPVIPAAVRGGGAEVEAVLAREVARTEANRCLRCDDHLQLDPRRCIACGLCVDVCPQGCLALQPAGRRVALLLDDDRCIRCRLCVERCPTDALTFAGATPRTESGVAG